MVEPVPIHFKLIKAIDEKARIDRLGKDTADLLNVRASGPPTLSGIKDSDYLSSPECSGGELSITSTLPIPSEILNRFSSMQYNCIMGLFVEAQRVWLTIDNEIYMWNYEDNDLAYYDGIKDVIICVGFVQPVAKMFDSSVSYLLVVATSTDIIILSVSLVEEGGVHEVHIQPTPLVKIANENRNISVIEGTKSGRIFLGTTDNCILEIVYREQKHLWNLFSAEKSKNVEFNLINRTVSRFSSYIPNMFKFTSTESIRQIVIDEIGQKLYTLSHQSTVTVYNISMNSCSHENYLPVSSLTRSAMLCCRTSVDKSHCEPLVHLTLLESNSGPLHLMLVSQSGVRFYLKNTLQLMHVRLPPPSCSLSRNQQQALNLQNVRLCLMSRGTVMYLCRRQEESDILFVVSPDPFPGYAALTESVSFAWPPGKAWALLPIGKSSYSNKFFPNLQTPALPAFHTQHLDPVRRFLLVSTQCLLHLELPGPIHRLMELLQSQEASNACVRNWYQHFGPEEAVFASLLLCSKESLNGRLAENATRAMFLYCCSPAFPTGEKSNNFSNMSVSSHSPHPYPQELPPLLRGILLYISRILVPVWLDDIVKEVSQKDNKYSLVLDEKDFQWLIYHMNNVHTFVTQHETQIRYAVHQWNQAMQRTTAPNTSRVGVPPAVAAASHISSSPIRTPLRPNQELNGCTNYSNIESIVLLSEEICATLPSFLTAVKEFLHFWKILSMHNFPLICSKLTPNALGQLRQTNLSHMLQLHADSRSLISSLTSALLETFLSDDASVDPISERLLALCPSLFANADALCAKASELIVKACAIPLNYGGSSVTPSDALLCAEDPDLRQRVAILDRAVDLYCEAGKNVDFSLALPRLISAGYYAGVVRLCHQIASLRDPDYLALQCFREKKHPTPDTLDEAKVEGRLEAYSHMMRSLDRLFLLTQTVPEMLSSPNDSHQVSAVDGRFIAKKELYNILSRVFVYSEDILEHYELIAWMLAHGMEEEVLRGFTSDGTIKPVTREGLSLGCSPHLETFLRSRAVEDVTFKDILWKHCELTGKRLEAAQVLDELAVVPSRSVTLSKREEYLSRAILLLKSMYGLKNTGDYLSELQDKLEVCQLQAHLINELQDNPSIPASGDIDSSALETLQYSLCPASQLFHYADHFSLPLTQLKLLQASTSSHKDQIEFDLNESLTALPDDENKPDVALVEEMWEKLLSRELTKQPNYAEALEALATLFCSFYMSRSLFPLEFIADFMENWAGRCGFPEFWPIECFIRANIPWRQLTHAYTSLLRNNERSWLEYAPRMHLYNVMHFLILSHLKDMDESCDYRRQAYCNQYSDLISTFLSDLRQRDQPSSRGQDLIQRFKELQAQLLIDN